MHVSLHGAASAHPQSPRIGRTLPSSLGELTGGAGLHGRVSALDSHTACSGKELQGWDGCYTGCNLICVFIMENHKPCWVICG